MSSMDISALQLAENFLFPVTEHSLGPAVPVRDLRLDVQEDMRSGRWMIRPDGKLPGVFVYFTAFQP